MAEAKPETKVDSVSFREDPLKFCQHIYEEASKHNEAMEQQVVEDRAFFDGVDDMLVRRAKSPDVVRAAHFVHEARTAIETREAAVIDRAQEDDPLIRMNIKEENEEDEGLEELVEEKEAKLGEQLIKSGYLTDIYMQQFRGAEIQPFSVIKIGKEDKYEWVPKKKSFLQKGVDKVKAIWSFMVAGEMPPIEDVTVYNYELIETVPTVQWLDWDEFLWDKQYVTLQEGRYCGHQRWLEKAEILEDAELYEYDMAKVKEMFLDAASDGGGSNNATTAEQVETQKGETVPTHMKDGKYLIVEWYIKTYDDSNRKVIKKVTVGNNRFILKDEFSFRGIGFPFHVRKAWPKLGRFEGTSSIELVKSLQRIYNDTFNGILDAATYGIFPPIMKKSTATIKGTPKWGPARFFEVDDINNFKQLEYSLGAIDLLPALSEAMSGKIRQMLNAPDVDQGVNDNMDEEKATKTRLRAMGANKRLRPLFESVRADWIEVAEMFVKINQEDDPSWILPVELDVPAFSGVTTPDEERMMAMITFQEASKSVLYAGPVGIFKLRQLWVDYLNKSRVDDIDSRCPTEEEIQQTIMSQIEMAQTQGEQNGGQEVVRPNGSNGVSQGV